MTNIAQISSGVRIACIGEAMIELSSIDLEQHQARLAVAGDAYNTAVYLKRELGRLKGSVDFITAVGSDALSDAMVEEFQREELGTDLVQRHATRLPGIYNIKLDSAGERTFGYWRSQSAARTMFAEFGLTESDFAGYDAIYLSAITLAILSISARHQLISICKTLKNQGKTVVFDSNYRPQLWEATDVARVTIDAMWHATTIALPSIDDEQALFPGASEDEIIARIERLGINEIALKRGAAGPLILSEGKISRFDLPQAPLVVDTTAAGDSFNAGYLAARVSGASPETSARSGHLLATRVIGETGAIIPRERHLGE